PLLAFSLILVMAGCKKEDYVTVPPALAHFTNQASAPYYVQNTPNSVFKVPVGVTEVSDKDRTIQLTVTSPTGATAGTQYTLSGTSVVIPAGKSIGYVDVKGIFSGFPGTRVDTLRFAITGGDVTPADYNKTFDLILRKYCEVNISDFVGNYNKSFDDGTYGPYQIQVLSATQVTATTGYIMIKNLWDAGGSTPIRVDLDWSDPANFKTSIPTAQPLYIDGTYGQANVRPTGNGTFSSCDQTFTLKYQVYVSAGSFAATTTTMAR
ncbi:MAG TPA: hypothetical protein VHK91_03500, partial [Flavisolibacter sp.]|nr:hypothetical protein [Flavisolibacter sp.]